MPFSDSPRRLAISLVWVVLLAYMFAQIEIVVEGPAGWATGMATWRIENHWMLDLFWGSRAMTGYHAWVFPFIALFFHFPIFLFGNWSWRLECRITACVMLFWLVEDFLWFVLNPAYGLSRFSPGFIPWHKHWLWYAPVDYWVFSVSMVLLLRVSYQTKREKAALVKAPGDSFHTCQ